MKMRLIIDTLETGRTLDEEGDHLDMIEKLITVMKLYQKQSSMVPKGGIQITLTTETQKCT